MPQTATKTEATPVAERTPTPAARLVSGAQPHGLFDSVAALQRSAGNRATEEVVRPSLSPSPLIPFGGQPLPPEIRSETEGQFSVNLGDVRVHTGPQANRHAHALGAAAYARGNDIVFGAGEYSPYSMKGRSLLSHELAHVVQQRRGGGDSLSALESGAAQAASEASHGGPVAVQGASIPSIACAPRSLSQSLNPSSLSDAELEQEVREIHQYLSGNPNGPDSAILKDALSGLEAEFSKRNQAPKQGGSAKKPAAKPPPASGQSKAPIRPRSLSESVLPSSMTDAELESEINLIRDWLRANPGGPDEAILRDAMAAMEAEVRKRPPPKPKKPPVPSVTPGSEAQQLTEYAAIIEGIKPSTVASGIYSMMYDGEEVLISQEQKDDLFRQARIQISSAVNSAKSKAENASGRYTAQSEVDREFWFTSHIIKLFGNIEDPGPVLLSVAGSAVANAKVANQAVAKNSFVEAARALAQAESAAIRADRMWQMYFDKIISTAETTVTVLEFTRDASFSIAIGIGAVLAAPVVFAGATAIVGTGTVGTGLAVIGTGATVTAGGGVVGGTLRGGSSVVGQALTGDVNLNEAWKETKIGAQRGAVDAATSVATFGVAKGLGPATTFAGKIGTGAVSGYAGGATGGALNATIEGKSGSEILDSANKSGISGAVGGGIAGGSTHFVGDSSMLARGVTGLTSGSAGGATSAYLEGGSSDDIAKAALLGGGTGFAGSLGAHPEAPTKNTPPGNKPPAKIGVGTAANDNVEVIPPPKKIGVGTAANDNVEVLPPPEKIGTGTAANDNVETKTGGAAPDTEAGVKPGAGASDSVAPGGVVNEGESNIIPFPAEKVTSPGTTPLGPEAEVIPFPQDEPVPVAQEQQAEQVIDEPLLRDATTGNVISGGSSGVADPDLTPMAMAGSKNGNKGGGNGTGKQGGGSSTGPTTGGSTAGPSGKGGKGGGKGSSKGGGSSSAGPTPALPDVRSQFNSTRTVVGDRIYDTTSGRLGVPGKVATFRSRSQQRGVSGGTGDDAGHRAGNRFGAPGDRSNLANQNKAANEYGTFKQLENRWSAKLKNGSTIDIEVTDVTRVGEDRPYKRIAKWTETDPNGLVTQGEEVFANTHTPSSRAKRGIPPTTSGQTNNVIDVDFANRRRK